MIFKDFLMWLDTWVYFRSLEPHNVYFYTKHAINKRKILLGLEILGETLKTLLFFFFFFFTFFFFC